MVPRGERATIGAEDSRIVSSTDGEHDRDRRIVAALRARVGPDVDDPPLTALIGELSVRSERFRQLWARHDARVRRHGRTVIDHPLVGQLQLDYEKLPIPDTGGQILAIYHAADTASAARLALLAAITSGR